MYFPAAAALLPTKPVWVEQQNTPGIIFTIIDNNNSSNNNNKGHPEISSHICFPICRVKRTVIRLPFHFHLECQACQRAAESRVSSARFLPSQLHSRANWANRPDTLRWSASTHINEMQMIGKNDMIHKSKVSPGCHVCLVAPLVCSGTPWATLTLLARSLTSSLTSLPSHAARGRR